MYYFLKLINLKRIYKQFIVLFLDIVISLIACLLTIIIIHDISLIYNKNIILILLYSIGFIPFFITFGLYRTIFRYSGFYSFLYIFNAVLIFNIFFSLILYFSKIPLINLSFVIVYSILLFFLIFSSRVFISFFVASLSNSKDKNYVIIFGVNDITEKLSQILNDKIYCIISDNKEDHNKFFNNFRIYNSKKLDNILEKNIIKKIYICEKNINKKRKKFLIEKFKKYNIGIIFIPKIDKLYKNNNFNSFDDLDLDIIINRNLEFDINKIKVLLNNKNCLITGAGGSIGSELSKQICEFKINQIILVDSSEYNLFKIYENLKQIKKINNLDYKIIPKLINLTDTFTLKQLLNTFNIDIIFHVAAYKHVSLVENNIIESVYNNIFGTFNLLNNINYDQLKKIILISSDKAVKPINIMGLTKRYNELLFQLYSKKYSNTIFCAVRFGNVFKSDGSVVPKFIEQINSSSIITVTDPEVKRYFMSINEAVSLILNATYFAKRFEIFMLKMGEQVKIVDLAKKIINLSGKIYTFDNLNKMQDEVKIEFIGLSKGEKIEEDLFEDENFQITDNSNILILNNSKNSFKFENFENDIKKLFKSVNVYDQKEVVSLINKIKNKNYLE